MIFSPMLPAFYRISGQNEADRLAEEAIMHFENGFRAMKIKLWLRGKR